LDGSLKGIYLSSGRGQLFKTEKDRDMARNNEITHVYNEAGVANQYMHKIADCCDPIVSPLALYLKAPKWRSWSAENREVPFAIADGFLCLGSSFPDRISDSKDAVS
jgi:hypothetical protein